MTLTLYQELGAKLKIARESCDLTQTKTAVYLGINRVLVSYYENGTREIDILTLTKLSNLYGYSIEHFLSNEVEDEVATTLAFRATGLVDTDMEVLARSNNFLQNLNWLYNLLDER